MTDYIPYHSAVNVGPVEEDAYPLDRWVSKDGKREAFAHDFADGLQIPSEFDRCEVLYVEPPFPHGWKVFHERAGIEPKMSYNEFFHGVTKALAESGKPAVMLCSTDPRVQLKAVPPAYSHRSALLVDSRTCVMLWYNLVPPKEFKTNTELIQWLATQYECVGDFASGYGYTGRLFSQAGKGWVLSDLDPSCIGYIAQHAEEWGA